MKDLIISTSLALGMYFSIGVSALLIPLPYGMAVAGVASGLWACLYYYGRAPTSSGSSE
jgi:hypothetical protein